MKSLVLVLATMVAGEPTGQPESGSPQALAQLIDQTLGSHWKELGIRPTKEIDDATFLRRLSLDLRGTIPTRFEVDEFLKDDGKDKRARWIETLLVDPATAAHLGQMWRDLLLQGAQPSRYSAPLAPWLAEQFQQRVPFAEIAHELISAAGNSNENGAVAFLASYREEREAASAVAARTFLGLQIQCAQCHDHPTDKWSQEQFNEFTAFFARTRVQGGRDMEDGYVLVDIEPRGRGELDRLRRFMRQRRAELDEEDQDEMRGMSREEMAEQMMARLPPEARERLEAARERQAKFGNPKFLDGAEFYPAAQTTLRQGLADWVVHEDNPWFARAVVNRMWAKVFGRALTEPVDDLSGAEDELLPQLLDTLASRFHRDGTDIQSLLHAFLLTDTYARAPSTLKDDEKRQEHERHFAAHPIRPFTAEQVLNALTRATELDQAMDRRQDRRPGRRGGPQMDDPQEGGMGAPVDMVDPRMLQRFRYVFSDDEGGSGDSFEAGIPQALFLMNGRMTNDTIDLRASPLLREIVDESLSDKYRLQQMFYAALGRKPSSHESSTLFRLMRNSGRGKAGGITDVYWALLNSSEFLTNH